MENDGLPLGWTRAQLGSIVEEAQPGFACGRRDSRGFVQLRMNNIGMGGFVKLDSVLKVPKELTDLPKYELKEGDIIFNNTNSAELVGKTVLFRGELENCVYSNHLTRIRVLPGIASPEWLTWFLMQEQQEGTFERMCHRFVGQASVNRKDLLKLEVRLPPYREQIRIAAKLEALFENLRNARQALDNTPTILKDFRKSILSNAFRGELTNRSSNETAEEFLNSIRDERAGQHMQNPNPEAAFSDLPELPAEWAYSRVDSIAEVRLGRQRSPKNRSHKYPKKYIRAANIVDGNLDLSDVKDMDFNPREFETYKLREGDVLLSEGSGSPLEAGKCAVWDGRIPDCCIQNTVIRVRSEYISPRYLLYVFQYARLRGDFARLTKGIQIAHLGAERLSAYAIPIAPRSEIDRIVSRIDSILSVANIVSLSVDTASRCSAQLEKSILAKALRGELVPQDSSDTPALEVLRRIGSDPSTRVGPD